MDLIGREVADNELAPAFTTGQILFERAQSQDALPHGAQNGFVSRLRDLGFQQIPTEGTELIAGNQFGGGYLKYDESIRK